MDKVPPSNQQSLWEGRMSIWEDYMSIASYTTEDGVTLEVFSSLYLDWGLSITTESGKSFSNPSCLSSESYGIKFNSDKYDDWDEAEQAEMNGEENCFVEWDEDDWVEMLKSEADTFIEAYLGTDDDDEDDGDVDEG